MKPFPFFYQLRKAFDSFEQGLAWILAACMWFMAISLGTVVFLRYGFGYGATWLNEVAVYLLAITSLLGIGHVYEQDRQVRLDIFYAKMSIRSQKIVNLVGNCIFLIPLCCFLFFYSIEYVNRSWLLQEASAEASGLPGVYLVKTVLLVGPVLILLRALVHTLQILRSILTPKNP